MSQRKKKMILSAAERQLYKPGQPHERKTTQERIDDWRASHDRTHDSPFPTGSTSKGTQPIGRAKRAKKQKNVKNRPHLPSLRSNRRVA